VWIPVIVSICQSFLIFAADAAAPAEAPNDISALLRVVGPIVMIMILFYFMMIRPQKQKDQDMKSLISNLKENDRVVTIGGIHGVVTNVQRDADRVTIRVDESTGTKIKINMSAIARVLTGDEQESPTGVTK